MLACWFLLLSWVMIDEVESNPVLSSGRVKKG